MSIASEYAKRVAAAQERPDPFTRMNGSEILATVGEGGLLQTRGANLDTAEALRFAQWIIRTFGEPGKHMGVGQVYDLRDVPL